ncbi:MULTISPECIES: phosphoribosylamine--glycine ligase [Dietzia]|uniref:Phosphoribosylamine--glycine ligase n=1 Tax=Dietzia cinnamea TaxID=321318 RepID=A0AAW5Q7U0_9ACTN|nr:MULTISPECIES: phosphoribosylamine--glycine ligase [Dietzia]PWD96492.1 phosphoribosylamine--glycine ligase [Dietzia maris]MBM7229737.1 phosphoribosylamine--glycine ligase [Dietzia cinnamea]MCT1638768.1 phosphoribosylamine--glycine ligase [Dietzia cinnamea]MCT1863192.1 phosphoribosylamine--glycine ligase [Dietzia cinnamea]MCT2029669.1 phosphoribosylamine--glycine ligase [Dietzia cinnamea]
MRILVIGSGAREHALLVALAADPTVTELHAAPGNPGMVQAQCHEVAVTDPADVTALARRVDAGLVIIGPEVPLVAGVADALRDVGVPVFGPSADAARIEGSKAFAKDVMAAAGVKTARAEIVDSPADLDDALDRFGPTWVVKDDGLAAGKGVVVTPDRSAARAHALACLDDGHPVLLESFLDGPEVSLFCLVDGETVVPLLPAQDHKRVGEGDRGPNTGGMGAYAPLPWLPEGMVDRIVSEVCEPVAREMVARGCGFSGLLYAGLAITYSGPEVVEFNCRFGDPETQAVLALLESPLGETLHAVATGRLADLPPLVWRDGAAVTVVLAAEHYPATPRRGDLIEGAEQPGVLHAGTARDAEGRLVSAGGRVLSVVGTGEDLAAARAEAYRILDGVDLPGGHFRRDIGLAAEEGRISVPG